MSNSYDAAIIGGGMAGASVAYELARESSVVLLESEPMLATHSTGRSAATYLPSYGGPSVRALTVASRPLFGSISDQWGDVHPLTPRPVLWVAVDEETDTALTGMIDARSGGPGELETLTAEETLQLCPVMNPDVTRRSALDSEAQDIDVLGMHQAYVRGLKARGGTIRTSAAVRSLQRNGSGWTVELPGGTVHADLIVDAAGAWADLIAAQAGVPPLGLVPKRRTLFMSPAPGKLTADGPTVGDPAERWYFKPEGDGVLASPADADPVNPGDAKPSELGIARAMEEINKATTLGLRTVRRSWGGLRTFAADGEPVAGLVSDVPGFGFLAGQGGYGIQMAPALAVAAAALLTGRDMPADIPVRPEALSPERFR
ncbi:FAD-binding oxidoreductase [Hoyosella sp. YIM 151337]|uniref:NAD(P)/FAD-dependent oxidoreductase n=1 Tax=Hoyosella sp. YIM 151337 TaxID=2992742 RepID=UPI002235F508|nr:FAD-dependent oxidoreductase [Hoyosella sp. YIM 151337]MCW4355607.1 FAD-binding oxidoreductase [Hoyosella sp. YIM 151337]